MVNDGDFPPILILPGIHGSPDGHWQTAWESLLPDARRVPARDWSRPVCADWVTALERAVATSGPDVVLVAHSLGCLQVVHWAARTALSVRLALLVAPPDPFGPSFPPEAMGFAPLPLAPLPFPSALVASADDPYAHPGFSRECADAWGSQFLNIGPRGHINLASDLGDWPEGRRILSQLVGKR